MVIPGADMKNEINNPFHRQKDCGLMQSDPDVSRRSFLKAMAVAPVAFSVRSAKAQEGTAQKPKLAIVSRHLQWTDWQSGVEVAQELGYPGIIWTVRRGAHVEPENVARDLPEIVAATRAAGLAVPMIITRIRDVNAPLIESMLETFSSLGITRYRAGTPRYDYSKSFPYQYDAFRKDLEALEQLNAKYGVTACFHTHSSTGSLGGVGWDLWMVMKDLDPRYIGINFDIGHIVARTGVGWRDIAHAARNHIQSISLKDVRAWVRQENPRPGTWPWGREFVPPGEGMVAFDDFFEFLYTTGFSGPMEVYHEYQAPIPGSDARINMLGSSYGNWDLEVPRDYYLSLLARDVRFYKSALRNAGFEI